MSIKEKIYAVCVENKLLKKIYIFISYIKLKKKSAMSSTYTVMAVRILLYYKKFFIQSL